MSKLIIDGKEATFYSSGNGYYRYAFILTKSYPKIDITIEEYIRYESIIQPYPVMFKLVDKDTNKEYTWGDKVKVGSTIKVSSIIYNHQTLWSIHGYLINGDPKTYSYSEIISKDIVVTKTLSFSCNKNWLLSTAEPLFAYDPSMINNIGLKNLGYLPDISGQGRHLSLYNFQYKLMSGKNGYLFDFDTIRVSATKVSNTEDTLIVKRNNSSSPRWAASFGKPTSDFEIYVEYPNDTYNNIIYTIDGNSIIKSIRLENKKWNKIPITIEEGDYDNINFSYPNINNSYEPVTIKQKGLYEGSLYFDGVTNYGTVQNLTYGGQCLISKVNWSKVNGIFYDQRDGRHQKFAIYISSKNSEDLTVPAYNARNDNGDTYINNILNEFISINDLKNTSHVITIINSNVTQDNTVSPFIGSSKYNAHYTQFAMWRTILLPEVPNAADRTILNKWCGLPTGYLPKPEYYWDVTGKSNSDTATRNTIKNLGTAKPVASTSDEDAYSLQNKNVAYEGMSGYNGYPVVFGNQKTWNYLRPESDDWKYGLSPTSITIYKALSTSALLFTIVREVNGTIRAISIPSFKINVEGLKSGENIRYRYISSDDTSTYADITITENGQHELPASAPIEVTETTPNSFFVGFQVKLNDNTSAKGLIIKILPEYPNGLCLDGITNYIECANIPAFTDYTYIIKFKDFDDNLYNSCVQYKGPYKQGGSAFVQDYISTDHSKYQLSFGGSNKISNTISVGFCTKTNYNGSTINSGTNSDGLGIVIGKWASYRKMIFYKEMLWSKSINNTYHINMLRNLINNGGIIDLNDSIFDQTSNE